MITNEAMDEASKRKLALLLQKQFFELQKYLSDLHSGVALDRVIAVEKIKAKYRDLMDEASNDLTGEALANRLGLPESGITAEQEKIRSVKVRHP